MMIATVTTTTTTTVTTAASTTLAAGLGLLATLVLIASHRQDIAQKLADQIIQL
ncbi:MAG TPA: hypothetical protein GX520_01530 [Syntrophaceticus sp.]|nr:hypothetical protein [Syntrophaceticus sp.]